MTILIFMNGNQSTRSRPNISRIQADELCDGIQSHTQGNPYASKQTLLCQNPHTAHMSNYTDRLASFERWPGCVSTPKEEFARAGFFCLGVGDRVKCFYCNGGLHNWRQEDQPWVEHAKWFPICEYVLQCKGEEFVEEIKKEYPSLIRPVPLRQPARNQPSKILSQSNQDVSTSIAAFDQTFSNGGSSSTFSSNLNSSRPTFSSNLPAQSFTLPNMSTHVKTLKKEFPQKQQNSPTNGFTEMSSSEIKNKIKSLLDEQTCKVCLDQTTNCLLLPCRHLCTCVECASSLRKCPICREKIEKIYKIYRS